LEGTFVTNADDDINNFFWVDKMHPPIQIRNIPLEEPGKDYALMPHMTMPSFTSTFEDYYGAWGSLRSVAQFNPLSPIGRSWDFPSRDIYGDFMPVDLDLTMHSTWQNFHDYSPISDYTYRNIESMMRPGFSIYTDAIVPSLLDVRQGFSLQYNLSNTRMWPDMNLFSMWDTAFIDTTRRYYFDQPQQLCGPMGCWPPYQNE
jgi:hypothetical protein